MVYDNLGDVVELMPYAEDWVKTLKEQGYHLYILSNYARVLFATGYEEVEALTVVDLLRRAGVECLMAIGSYREISLEYFFFARNIIRSSLSIQRAA